MCILLSWIVQSLMFLTFSKVVEEKPFGGVGSTPPPPPPVKEGLRRLKSDKKSKIWKPKNLFF